MFHPYAMFAKFRGRSGRGTRNNGRFQGVRRERSLPDAAVSDAVNSVQKSSLPPGSRFSSY
jgi:hypothetical protein